MKRFLLVLMIAASTLNGCFEIFYKIEMEPKGDKLIRKLTVMGFKPPEGERGRTSKEFRDTELAAMTKAYSGSKPEEIDGKYIFTGTFSDAMPNDVGGSGLFVRHESRMGVSMSYIERFRGNDSPGEVIEASLKGVDELVDILIGYMETQLGKESDFPKLRRFMNTKLRKDLKNVSVYTYLAFNPSRLNWLEVKEENEETIGQEAMARAVAYLIEREYVKPSDIPLLRRSFSPEEGPKKLIETILKRLASKARITDTRFVAKLTALLTDEEKLERSFEAYIRTTPQYKNALKSEERSTGDDPDDGPSKPAAELVIMPLLERIIHFRLNLFGGSSRLDMQLALPGKPVFTNGKWNAKSGTVTWKGELTARTDKTNFLPEICYALWAEPNIKFQKAHFGKVILHGQELMNYCLWRQGLTPAQAKIWNAILDKHKPGQSLQDAARSVSVPEEAKDYLQQGAELLLNAMKEEKPEGSTDD